jgi:enamine deaminase RidA (YjgF/YER057c/UK114 family)
MVSRQNKSTNSKWEDHVGYSRSVKIGNVIEVSGTVSFMDGAPFAPGSPYLQTRRILEIIRESLEYHGASLTDVIRTRIYVTDIRHWEEVARAHGEVFKEIKPATSMVQISALIEPEYVVEIEATAILK